MAPMPPTPTAGESASLASLSELNLEVALNVEVATEKNTVMVSVKASDGVTFPISKNVAMESGLIKEMIEMTEVEDEQLKETPIPIPNVRGSILEKVVKWISKHQGENIPEEDDEPTLDMSDWDVDFFNVEKDDIFQIILAANFMQIPGLINYGCKAIAKLMNDKETEEIRKVFNMTNDFTEDEEKKFKQQNIWCMEK